jgi:hypothetical protein
MSTDTRISTAVTAHLVHNRKTGAGIILLELLLPNGTSVQRRIIRDTQIRDPAVQVHELLHRLSLSIISITLHKKGQSIGHHFCVAPRPDDEMIERFRKLHGLIELTKH